MSEEPLGKMEARPGAFWFAIVFVALAALLVALIGEQTKLTGILKLIDKGTLFAKGKLFAQPAFWPAVGVIGMTAFGAVHAWQVWRDRRGKTGDGREALFWLRPLEYLAWFMAYVQIAPLIGYLPATLIFCPALAYRAGYRAPRTLLAAASTGLAIVLVFKTFLSVKIPGGAVYEYLPDAVRTFAIVNF